MEELVLKHRVGSGRQHCLSFLSEPDMIPKSNFTLPFFDPSCEVECSSCRGLFYFSNVVGDGVVCNLTTNEFKLLTPPYPKSSCCFCSLGYDPKSDDYKVIRNHKSYRTTELFSFKSDSWKVIPGPGDGTVVFADSGVYVDDGRCYWVTWKSINGKVYDLLSFDFSDETFYRSPLPPLVDFGSIGLKIGLFNYEGCLSAVGYSRVEDYKKRVATYFEVHVRRERSWERLFSVILIDVMDEPLGLRNGLLFLQGYAICRHSPSHLMVYDWVKEELREHAIYDMCPFDMCLLSYVKNQVALPDAKPIDSENTVLNGKVALGISHSSVLNRCSHSSSGTVLNKCSHSSSGTVLNKCSHCSSGTVLDKCSHCLSGTVLESKVPPKRCRRRRCLKRERMRSPFMCMNHISSCFILVYILT
ncbi:hypothetical protein OROGR_008464 [Orobanche gracilis]